MKVKLTRALRRVEHILSLNDVSVNTLVTNRCPPAHGEDGWGGRSGTVSARL